MEGDPHERHGPPSSYPDVPDSSSPTSFAPVLRQISRLSSPDEPATTVCETRK